MIRVENNQVSQQANSISERQKESLPSKPLPVDKSAEQVHKPIAPFPNRLRNNNNAQMEKMHEILIGR